MSALPPIKYSELVQGDFVVQFRDPISAQTILMAFSSADGVGRWVEWARSMPHPIDPGTVTVFHLVRVG